jgi:hypothetical protein
MPVTSDVTLHIVCDNPACPGNTLPVDDRAGWTFASVEVYGETATTQFVYCCSDCAGSLATAIESIPRLNQPPVPV